MGGYKQPQQLFTLAYFLTLGAHFDLVINLDGFNEVALPPTENTPKGVAPYFPRNWYGRVGLMEDILLVAVAERAALERGRRRWAKFFAGPLRYSATANAFWFGNDRILARQIADLQVGVLRALPNRTPGYTITGPRTGPAQPVETYPQLTDIWRSASLQMARLAEANSILYVHFLQPNQYVSGSKPFHPHEMKIAFSDDSPYRPGVLEGYPLLIETGKELVRARVNFYDLTKLFVTRRGALYADDCCHLSDRGYMLVAKEMVRRIGDLCTAPSRT